MKLKKSIALFCMIVLCIQALPVKQMGAMLFNNQFNEEIAHAGDSDAKKQTAENESDHYLPAYLNYVAQEEPGTNNHSTQTYFPLAQLHFAEVPTPPPNLV
jgi:hypothetical protein